MSNYLNMGDVSIAMDAYVYGLSSHAKILVRPIVKKKLGPNCQKLGKLSSYLKINLKNEYLKTGVTQLIMVLFRRSKA